MTNHRCVDCGSYNVAERPEQDTSKFKGGKVPYGFIVVSGHLQFEPFITGPILVDLMRAHAEGMAFRTISQSLVSQGVKGPGGGEWSFSSVARVVKRGRELSHLIPLQHVL